MADLGAGVFEHPEPDEHFSGATAPPRSNGPSCPWCGQHDTSTRVQHPEGEYLCSCGSLHNATDAEWRKLAEHRKHVIERQVQNNNEEGG